MRGEAGPQWRITHDVPWDVNHLFWLRRRLPGVFVDPQWRRWLEGVVHGPAGPWPDAIAARAPVQEWTDRCRATWPEFVREWDPVRLYMEREVFERGQRARLDEVMGRSHAEITLLQTDEPGLFAWDVGGRWVLGRGYLDPEALRALIAAVRPAE